MVQYIYNQRISKWVRDFKICYPLFDTVHALVYRLISLMGRDLISAVAWKRSPPPPPTPSLGPGKIPRYHAIIGEDLKCDHVQPSRQTSQSAAHDPHPQARPASAFLEHRPMHASAATNHSSATHTIPAAFQCGWRFQGKEGERWRKLAHLFAMYCTKANYSPHALAMISQDLSGVERLETQMLKLYVLGPPDAPRCGQPTCSEILAPLLSTGLDI